jgi:arsenite methyltransferase
MATIRDAVHERYRERALELSQGSSCCAPSDGCCAPSDGVGCGGEYGAEPAELGLDTSISLGCGNPTLLADLEAGETVLDLGSGGGLDVLLSARRVAPGGHAYGLDMTDEMLEVARSNQARAGVENATFLKGTIEAIPLPDGSVDVIISNCVINLAEDKGAVIREAARVLRPGGRLAVADMVEVTPLAPEAKRELDAWAGCVSGTIPVDEYRAMLSAAGFDGIEIEVFQEHRLPDQPGTIGNAYIRARVPVS